MDFSFIIVDTDKQFNAYSKEILKIFAEYHKWRMKTLYKYKPEMLQEFFGKSESDFNRIIQSYESAISTGIPYENFISFFENKLKGYYKLHLLKTEEKFVGQASIERYSNKILVLHKMYVKPAYRGKKLGVKILNRIVQTAKEDGFSKIYLETLPILKSAIKTYENFGFIYRDYYPTPNRSEEEASAIHSIYMEYTIN